MKRIIATLTLIALLITSTAFASEADFGAYTPAPGSADLLSVLDIQIPEEYASQGQITKSEFIYLVMQAMNVDYISGEEYLQFPDVKLDVWYHDAVITARSMGIVGPKADESFGVDDLVTPTFAVDTVMAALGFNVFGNSSVVKSRFAKVYRDFANAAGTGTALTLADAQNLIYEMLLSGYVEQTIFGAEAQWEYTEDITFLEHRFKVTHIYGRLTGNQYTAIGGGKADENQIEIDGEAYNSACGDLGEFLGYEGEFFIDTSSSREKVIAMVIENDNDETYIKNNELYKVQKSGNKVYLEYESESKVKKTDFSITCDFIYNGVFTDFSVKYLNELTEAKTGDIKIVENSYGTTVIVTAYETMIVESVSVVNMKISGKNGEVIELPDEYDTDAYVCITKDDEQISISAISADDLVMFACNGDYYKLIVSKHTITGIVTEMNDEEIVIDDVAYKFSPYYKSIESDEHCVHVGTEAEFLFDIYGQLIDFDEDNVVYKGEYMFLVRAGKSSSGLSSECKIRAVSMDAKMADYILADKVYTDIGSKSKKAAEVVDSISGSRGIIYVEKDKDGKITRLLSNGSKLVALDAEEKYRKYKRGSGAFLTSSNDANFPEFFTTDATKALQVPVTSSSDDMFDNEKNYKSIVLSSELKDAENAYVQAYNYDDFNCPEIVLVCKEVKADLGGKGNLYLVDSFGTKLNTDGDEVDFVRCYTNGAQVDVIMDTDEVMNAVYTDASGAEKTRRMQAGDIVRFFFDNVGKAFTSQYIRNIDTDFEISDVIEGRNDGNAYVIGTVDAIKGNYVKLELADGNTMVFLNSSTVKPTVYDISDDKVYSAKSTDLVKGDLVLLRVYYTSITDIIMKQN